MKLGIDPQALAGVINTSSGRCWSSDVCNPWPHINENAPASRGYQDGFATQLMLKDLGLAVEAAGQVKQPGFIRWHGTTALSANVYAW